MSLHELFPSHDLMLTFNTDPDLLEFMADRNYEIQEAMREADESDLQQLKQLMETHNVNSTYKTTT